MQPRRPRGLSQQHIEQPKRDVEESKVLGALGRICRVEDLQGIQPDRPQQEPVERHRRSTRTVDGLTFARSPFARSPFARSYQSRQEMNESSRCHDRIQRQQQVDRASIGRDRQAEGERDHRQYRESAWIAPHDQRQDRDRSHCDNCKDGERPGAGQRGGTQRCGLDHLVEPSRCGQGPTNLKVREDGIERSSRRKLTLTVYSPGGANRPRLRGTSVVYPSALRKIP